MSAQRKRQSDTETRAERMGEKEGISGDYWLRREESGERTANRLFSLARTREHGIEWMRDRKDVETRDKGAGKRTARKLGDGREMYASSESEGTTR